MSPAIIVVKPDTLGDFDYRKLPSPEALAKYAAVSHLHTAVYLRPGSPMLNYTRKESEENPTKLNTITIKEHR